MTWWKIKAKGESRAELSIYGDIGESWWGESVTAKECCKEIAAIDADTIDVRINSYGGAVADGLAIFNALQRHPAAIATHNDGVAMSIASLIFMAGSERHSAENALFMIHAPWGMAAGNAADMRDMADILDKYAEGMISAYRGSGLSDDAIRALLTDGKDHFYTAAEARADGFVTDITDALPIAAQFTLNRFTRPRPHNLGVPTMADSGNTAAAPEQPAAPVVSEAPNIAAIEAAAEARAMARIQTRNEEFDRQIGPIAKKMPHLADLVAKLRGDVSVTVEAAGQQVLAKMAEGCEPLMQHRIEIGQTSEQKFAAATTAAIRARAGLEDRDPQNEWTGRKLIEMARASLELQGVNCRGRLPLEIAAMALTRKPMAAQTTSDFDIVLENTMHKELLQAWRTAPDTWSRICKVGSVGDLRAWNRLNPGTIGDIDAVNEAGEYVFKNIPDAIKEQISAKRRGNRIAITPEVLINDDLSYFSDVPAMFGRAARRTIETTFYTLLVSNSKAGPTMLEDSKALFHADHGNLVTTGGSAPSVTSIDAARQALASQKDPSGNEYLDITPAIWLGPMSLGSTARVVNNSGYDPDTANKLQRANPVGGLFRDIIDTPRLSGTDWYVFADPSVMPVFEVVFLDGQREPMLSQESDFATSGLTWKVELPFGVGAIGWRGAYRNDGA